MSNGIVANEERKPIKDQIVKTIFSNIIFAVKKWLLTLFSQQICYTNAKKRVENEAKKHLYQNSNFGAQIYLVNKNYQQALFQQIAKADILGKDCSIDNEKGMTGYFLHLADSPIYVEISMQHFKVNKTIAVRQF